MTEQAQESPGRTLPNFLPPGLGDDVIFVVEDDHNAREAVERYLKAEGFTVAAFPDGISALQAMAQWRPAVLVTDNEMPGMTGVELAEKAMESAPDLRLIVMTGAGSEAVAQASLRLGASDYLTKPFELPALARAVTMSLLKGANDRYDQVVQDWIRDAVGERTRDMKDATLNALGLVVGSLESKSMYFEGHSAQVSHVVGRLARALDFSVPDIESIRAAGRIHDIGMSGISEAITDKKGSLGLDERAEIEAHCLGGAEIVASMEHLGDVARYVLEHHERFDGSGYPEGKKGNDISVGGQVLALAEVWTALLGERPYRPAMSTAAAMDEIRATARHFAPAMLDALESSDLA